MNAVILGHVCIDRNESENASYTTAGSPAVFIHKIFSQLSDVTTSVIAPYGKDFEEFKKDLPLLELENIPVKTLVYENISKENRRSQKALNLENSNPPELNDSVNYALRNADLCIVAPLTPSFKKEYLESAFSNLKVNCTKVLIPQGYYRNFDPENNVVPRDFEEQEIISMFDLVIVSDQDGENMFQTAKEWVEKYNVLVIVTTGKDGAVAVTKNGNINLPARTVKEKDIVDTVGSGDIFTAAFAYKYYLSKNIKEAGKFANEIARQCLFCTPDNIKIDLTNL